MPTLIPLQVGRSESKSWEVFAGVSLDAGTSVSSRFSANSSNQSGRSRSRPLVAWLLSLFLFMFLVFVGSPRFADVWGWVSSLRGVAGPDESCGNDVEDKLALELEEPVDNPGTKISTKFSVLHRIISHCWSAAVFDHCPTHVNIWVLRRVCLTTRLQAWHRGFAHRHEELKVVNVYLWLHHLFALLHGLWEESWSFGTLKGFQFFWA